MPPQCVFFEVRVCCLCCPSPLGFRAAREGAPLPSGLLASSTPPRPWGVGESRAQQPLVLRGCLRGMPYPAGTLIGSSAPTAGVALGACPDPDTLVGGRRSVISRGLVCSFFWGLLYYLIISTTSLGDLGWRAFAL